MRPTGKCSGEVTSVVDKTKLEISKQLRKESKAPVPRRGVQQPTFIPTLRGTVGDARLQETQLDLNKLWALHRPPVVREAQVRKVENLSVGKTLRSLWHA